jgi:hypothetical protein
MVSKQAWSIKKYRYVGDVSAVDPKIRRVQKLFPAPCQRGESPPEVFFIAMLASGAMSE